MPFARTARKGTFLRRLKLQFNQVATHRRLVRGSFIAANVAILGVVAAIVIINPRSSTSGQVNAITAGPSAAANPLDQLASAKIALTVARMSGLAETTAITNQADSQSAELTMASASATVVSKPQVVTTAFKTNKDIVSYTTVGGDTVSSLAAKYGVTSDSIRLSNNLSGDGLQVGTNLLIPPVNGMVYTVNAGDTPDSLATKYNSNKDKIIAFNDAEISGLKPGTRIVIPDAIKIVAVAKAATSYNLGWGGGGSATYGYNGYDYGYCTWYVANKRASAGNPVPSNLGNASTWATRAAAYGLATGRTPQVGAAGVTSTSGAGHVVYVEQINDDGSIWVSEMNSYGQVSMTNSAPAGGWGRVDWKLISADRANSVSYVY
ncbi:MAG: LysM peptidoglycan-binding domain-containing protein [Candidatus Saccharimonadales bacterium]